MVWIYFHIFQAFLDMILEVFGKVIALCSTTVAYSQFNFYSVMTEGTVSKSPKSQISNSKVYWYCSYTRF